jgi:glycosyltransferase involved in cell wall biosynthesis
LSILIDALQRLRRRDWQLLIFGEGQTRVETERQIAASGLRDHIHLNGEVPPDAVAGLMAGCHAVVLPSLQEGCPYVVLEALSLGLPVVACAVGGVAELIADGKNGLLVPPADPDALAAAITRVIEDPELLDRCRREAGAHGAAYTADDMVEGVVAAYRDALATRRAAQGAT